MDNKWPEDGDSLIRADLPDWQHNAVVNQFYEGFSAWSVYIDGYRQAADMLVDRVLQEDRSKLNPLVYPIVFLYRHHCEIVLKGIILVGSRLFDEPVEVEELKGHGVMKLWADARGILEKRWPGEDREPVNSCEALLRELDGVDPGSYAFRYPVNAQGGQSLPGLELINVRHLGSVAGKMADFLSCCFEGLWNDLGEKERMLSDLRQMYADER